MSRIVFLHGGVINRHMWATVIDQLPDQDCVAIDLPGHGELSDERFTMDRAVEVTLDAAGDSAVLVGLSLGGYVAQALATREPDKVAGLVISGSTINYTGWDGISTRLYGYLFPVLVRPATKAFARKLRSDFASEFAEPIIASGLSARGAGQALRRLPGIDYGEALSQSYKGPIVVANGERDTDNRAGEELFTARNPQTEVVTITDAGHACAMQRPEAFAEAIRTVLASAG